MLFWALGGGSAGAEVCVLLDVLIERQWARGSVREVAFPGQRGAASFQEPTVEHPGMKLVDP